MASWDVLIRGGNVVDGTGLPAFTADVGVRDGRIAGVGKLGGDAHREIDADGLVVAPGFIDTRMAIAPGGEHEHHTDTFGRFYIGEGRIPLRRPGMPENVADVVVFLASHLSRYVTGQVIPVDGGLCATY